MINLKICSILVFLGWHRSQKASLGQKTGVESLRPITGGSEVLWLIVS